MFKRGWVQDYEQSESKKKKLTSKLISTLIGYCGKAIRDKSTDADKMFHDVWATYYHMSSTDKEPKHQFCPKGKDNWCKYEKANGTLALWYQLVLKLLNLSMKPSRMKFTEEM